MQHLFMQVRVCIALALQDNLHKQKYVSSWLTYTHEMVQAAVYAGLSFPFTHSVCINPADFARGALFCREPWLLVLQCFESLQAVRPCELIL